MPSVVQNLTRTSLRWELGLLVSVLTACGADVEPPATVEDQDALASTEQELDGECTADWAANPCTVADSAACGTGSAGADLSHPLIFAGRQGGGNSASSCNG